LRKVFDKTKFKAVAFDLDGTLLKDGVISSYAKQAIRLLSNYGIIVIIATGRGLPIIPNELQVLEGIKYIVSSSGACITDASTRENIYRNEIDKKTAVKVIKCIEKYDGASSLIHPDKATYSLRFLEKARKNANKESIKQFKVQYKAVAHLALNMKWKVKKSRKPIEKIDALFDSKDQCANVVEEIKDNHPLEALTTNGLDVEITRRNTNKATGLEYLCKIEKMNISEIVGFGDSQNDYSMLQKCGYAVVMGNANDQLKSIADYVAPHINEDGAACSVVKLFELEMDELNNDRGEL
jgi:Cof subfamily protein (haloacid dehalogenase superfamily)